MSACDRAVASFLEREKTRQRTLRRHRALFSREANCDGTFQGAAKPFCLHEDHSDENLAPAFPTEALEYFAARGIEWHGGVQPTREKCGGIRPTNHLCDSQVSCVNTLFPFRRAARPLTALLSDLLAMRGLAIAEVLSFQLDAANGSPAGAVAFEWIGADNYLRERHFGKVAKNSQRRRGRNATSADFAFRVRLDDGRVGLILGEWKYCESYRPKNIRYSGKTDRLAIYEHALERLWPHRSLPGGASWEDLFFDPFGQLMRLQLLAAEIERAGREGRPEMDATFACVLHVAPRANSELRERITSEGLKHLGNDIHQVWARIAPEGRFFGVDSEALLAAAAAHMPDRASAAYLEARYLPMR